MTIPSALGTCAIALCMASPVASETALSKLVGDWSARGVISVRADAEPETGRCRVSVLLDDDREGITIRGRCAVAAGSGAFTLRIIDDGDRTLRAGFRSPLMEHVTQLAGRYEGDEIHLTTQSPFQLEEHLLEAQSTVTLLSDRTFRLREYNALAGSDAWRLVTDLMFSRVPEVQN